jgi:hypothetical protein
MLHMTKTIPPPAKTPRISVPVSQEAREAFERLAKAGNMSTGAAIASWLDDTVEGVEYLASTLERARKAPKAVMREMHSYAQGLADETGDMLKKISEKGKSDRAASKAQPLQPGASSIPPSCNTGGKLATKRTGKPL